VHLKTADPADLERIVKLVAGQRVGVASLRAAIGKDDTAILVMRADADIVGCVSLQTLEDDTWYLSMLAVDPDRQAGGVGKAIMAGAERFARERGAQRIKISVINLRASLIAWYERLGYRQTGAVESLPDDSAAGTPLRGDLALVTLAKQVGG
jgi:ribosomal protein S18 acetylase RimI-like enzyme